MKKENKFLPEGYRFLNQGEKIQKDDYFWNREKHQWSRIYFDADTSNWVAEQIIRVEDKNQ